jgi:Flp pilus assembly protein TadD
MTPSRARNQARHSPRPSAHGGAEINVDALSRAEKWHWAAPALIVLAILVTFAPICGHDFTNWDDNINVTHNPLLNPPTAASLLYFWEHPYQKLYIPLAYTAWWLLARIARVDAPDVHGIWLNPYIFHAANLLLHVGVCLVVFQLLRLLTGRRWAACAGALLFALHPLQVEPVAWVTGLKDLSCGLLSMVALWQYVVFAREGSADHSSDAKAVGRSSRHLHYAAATAALVGAMLCKPSAVTVPIIAAVIDRLLLQRRWRQIAAALLPWLAVSVAFTAISVFFQPDVAGRPEPLWTRPLIAADALAFYLGKLFAPIRLAAIYPHSEQQVLASPLVYVTWLVPVAIAFIAWRFRQAAPWAAAGALIFVAALLPVLGLAPFEYESISTVADRYVYVAMLGPSLAPAGLLGWLHSRASRPTVRYAASCGCAIAALAVFSARQARYWQDSKTLFTRVLALDPRSDVAYCDLAGDALANGRPDEAERYARRATELFPGRPNNGITLGIALQSLGRHAEAAAAFLKVSQAHPDNVIALTYLASELARSGHEAQAMAVCRAAIQVGPNFPDAHRLMATLLSAQGKFTEALPEAAEAVRLDPSVAANHLTYGKLLAAMGHQNEAEQQFAAARAIDPEGRDAADDARAP